MEKIHKLLYIYLCIFAPLHFFINLKQWYRQSPIPRWRLTTNLYCSVFSIWSFIQFLFLYIRVFQPRFQVTKRFLLLFATFHENAKDSTIMNNKLLSNAHKCFKVPWIEKGWETHLFCTSVFPKLFPLTAKLFCRPH